MDISNYINQFKNCPIDEFTLNRIILSSYKNSSLSLNDLRLLKILHFNFESNISCGEIICNVAISDKLIEIFKRLFLAEYQIEKVKLIDFYNSDDEQSMADNNSSCFNHRFIAGTQKLSKHALGLAIDINPLYNPCVKIDNDKIIVSPEVATPYSDRTKNFYHKISHDDLCYKLFNHYGFNWGGDWESLKDYQHFEI